MECRCEGSVRTLLALATGQVNTGGNRPWLVTFIVAVHVFDYDDLIVLLPTHHGRDVEFELKEDEQNAANEANGHNL